MDAFVEQLIRLVAPPRQPIFAGTLEAFREVERSLGLTLPDGYKRVVGNYGQGVWQEFWSIASPFAEDAPNHSRPWFIPRYNVTAGPDYCAGLREVEDRHPGTFPWPIYPSHGGLFPWALTDSGGALFWLTEGDPERWPTIYDAHELRPARWQRFDVPFSELVFTTVTGASGLFREALGERFEYNRPDAFHPWRGWQTSG